MQHQRITAGRLRVGDKVIAYRDHQTGEVSYKTVASTEREQGSRRVSIFWRYEGNAEPFRIPSYEGLNAVHWQVIN